MMIILALIAVFFTVDPGTKSEQVIRPANQATHIVKISGDTLFVISSKTYAYTVDTKPGDGLVSTGLDAERVSAQLASVDGSTQRYRVTDKNGEEKEQGELLSGDVLEVRDSIGMLAKRYVIHTMERAVGGTLKLAQQQVVANVPTELVLSFTVGQRSPDATVYFNLPPELRITAKNTTINVIGRGEVALTELERQPIGRTGKRYSYQNVGSANLEKKADGGTLLILKHLDLRPSNGEDVVLTIRNVTLPKPGKLAINARYSITEPNELDSPGAGAETAELLVSNTISNFKRIVDRNHTYTETPETYISTRFKWKATQGTRVRLMQSLDNGKTWQKAEATIDAEHGSAGISGLTPDTLYTFRLIVEHGPHAGPSNSVRFFSGKMDVKRFGVLGDGVSDDTEHINLAIDSISRLGGGTLFFSEGIYPVRTVHLKSNVYLYISALAVIKALKGTDAPETTWFSDRAYRSGLSPTDTGPYEEPENWLTKQDVGHTYFRNTLFFGERLDNVKIIGNGRITGDGNLVTGDRVMNNAPDNRADKMFTFKLCTNIEIGGLHTQDDLWYDEVRDEPYYINERNEKRTDLSNMLHIDRGGHFVLLATGTDSIHVHNTYFAKHHTGNARDIYDFMGCNEVMVTNIYSKVSSDDIVKLGSDCSLGFTRKAKNYWVRNIIGDTNCNLFQIGSETADDITDVYVDNIYVLGANKAGFSISTNDGGHVRNIFLNSGRTGRIHSRSKMLRTTTPFFLSISNRGRVLGAEVTRQKFREHGTLRDELLVTNVNIGIVDNIVINGVDVTEIYGGSSYRDSDTRWKPYDGSQRRAAPIVAGYRLPGPESIVDGTSFRLPNGHHTGFVTNVTFDDVHILAKGGNPLSDTTQRPPELGVGQYNVSNLKTQPSYGFWARHVKELNLIDCTFNYEKQDGRYALFLENVRGAKLTGIETVTMDTNNIPIAAMESVDISISKSSYYRNNWRASPLPLAVTELTAHDK
ncbi:MAG TPA: glycosyl hydrolase family 28-related protein [Parapedobacter sp.]|uniref:glycosyl hydrolase family 28-related protein n=1 Tax=Parapedobacter sp. TaxID=1958893 RepID=UPI002C9417E1|nr:glycosyl hydrolase family 28-related protein [Parapedobacter sp.]HWK57634.1 glycosyl hydrolase family 28-related protein [Parapedobacter sp.]